jgi:hypothetical protein
MNLHNITQIPSNFLKAHKNFSRRWENEHKYMRKKGKETGLQAAQLENDES